MSNKNHENSQSQSQSEKSHHKKHFKFRKVFSKRILPVLCIMFYHIRYYLDLLIDKIFGFFYDFHKKSVGKPSNPIVTESATSLARKIKKREVTSEEVVQAFIDRINEVNPIVNAIVDQRFEEALEEARQIDKDIASGTIQEVDFQEKPFLGVPFTSKESTACKGLSWTFGLIKRKLKKASFDAECVESMKKAGGILLGVSNVPQLNLWQESSNPLFGVTNNPYNSTRNVGGSSGGESSILAACGSPLGIGTDIGGSARIPAFMCGIYGHKTTSNLISTKGLTFRTGEEHETMVSVGPMTRFADDLKPFLKALVGGKNADKLKLDRPVPLKDLKVYFIIDPKDPFVSPFRKGQKRVLFEAVEHFTDLTGERPKELTHESLKYTGKLWRYWMSQEKANFLTDINNREGQVSPFKEILKYIVCQTDFTLAVIYSLIQSFFKKVDDKWARDETECLKEALLSKLDDNSILLYPSAPWPASYHHTAYLRPYNFNLFSIWNVLKFPVTQVPMGLNHEGLPLGLQVVAAPFQDRLCLAVAKELESRFGGYVPPFPTSK